MGRLAVSRRRIAPDLNIEPPDVSRRQFEIVNRLLSGQKAGRGIEAQPGAAGLLVQADIAKGDAILGHFRRQPRAASLATAAAHFEKVRKIGGKADRQTEPARLQIEIAQGQPFVAGSLPEESDTPDLDEIMLQPERAVPIAKIGIG